MPAKKKTTKATWQVDFIDWRLSTDEKKFFLAELAKNSSVFLDRLSSLLEKNYKVSLSFDEAHMTYIASLTPRDEDDVNAGYCLTSRSDDPFTALSIGLYKHFWLCDDGDWDAAKRKTEVGWG